MTRKQRRLTLIAVALAVLGAATALILVALEDSIVFSTGPSDVLANPPAAGQRLRLGGLVEQGSVMRGQGTQVRFSVTDNARSIPVTYVGILPDLFREGQGVVVEGALASDSVFVADTVMARHDETYMPKEVVDALKAEGRWQGEAP